MLTLGSSSGCVGQAVHHKPAAGKSPMSCECPDVIPTRRENQLPESGRDRLKLLHHPQGEGENIVLVSRRL